MRLAIKRLSLLFALLLLLPLSTYAQDTPAWEVLAFGDGAQVIHALSPQGVAASIQAGSLPLRIGSFPSDPLVAISADRRALAALDFIPGSRLNVSIAAFGACCTTVRLANSGTQLAQIGGFSPNGRRFVVSYLAVTDEAARQFVSAIVTIDVERGVVIDRLEAPLIGGDFGWVRGWNDEGIDFMPFCYGCDRPPAGSLSRWNPETGEVIRDVSYYNAAQDILPTSGEILQLARRPDYPLPISQGMELQPNVVLLDDGSGIRVIYYNPSSLIIESAHWVADGWQVLVEHPNATVLMDRSGAKRNVPTDDKFLVGTPDGWLATRPLENGSIEIVHHSLTNLGGEVIARFFNPVGILQAPVLGTTASRGGFPAATSPVARLTCPNALTPRLYTGGSGRVISGGVNMRREASLTASTVTMVTDQVFNVLSGPNCDPTGIVWWQVGIGGVRGWMAESKDGVYLLEPVLN